MQDGALVNSDTQAFTSRVLVNGVERAHAAWQTDRELVGDLPAQVAGGHGIKQATGTITWAEQSDVKDTAVNPWNASAGWLPKAGDWVVIRAGDGVTEWPQFTGVIDKTSGSVGGLPQSTIIDYTDYLNRPFRHSAVLRRHPPNVEGGPFMGVGMSPSYAVDRLFRAAQCFATPRMESGVVMSAPLQTSLWPEYGIITAAGSQSATTTHGINEHAPWGWALGDFGATYAVQGAPVTRTDPVQITAMVAPAHAGNLNVNADYGTNRIRLWVTAGRVAVARLDEVEVCRVPLGEATIVSLLVKAGRWTIKTSTGGTATATLAVPAGGTLASVTISGDAATRAAGIQVSKPTAAGEFASLAHKATAYHRPGSLHGIMDALPSLAGRTVADVLEEVSAATLAPFWFDELGKLVMYGSDVLRDRAPVQTVTTLDDITKLSWSDSRLSIRSSVTVKYRYPALNRSRYTNVSLWEGSGETMDSGQEKELLAKEPADEDWVEPDNFAVSNAGGVEAFNAGRGTWVATHLEKTSGEWLPSAGYATWSPLRKVDEETWLFKVVAGNLPAGYQLVLGTPKEATNYSPRMRGVNMPVLRGRGKVQWVDMTLTSAITGPAGFPALEHNVGCWSVETDSTTIQTRVADFIARQVSAPSPIINGLSVIYDPRRQLGDVITISSPKLMGVELHCLVVGISNSAGDSFSQSLSVRIISAKSTFTTYNQLAEAWAGGNYASLQTAWAALNYNALEANTLEVTP